MTTQEKQALKGLLQDPRWRTFEELAHQICIKIALEESNERETTDETLKDFLLNRGQIKGINRLLQEVWNQINA